MESDGSATVEEPRSADEAEPSQSVSDAAEEILTRLLTSIQTGGRDEHRAAWMAIQDPDVMATLADGWRQSESTLSSVIAILEMIPGQVQRARTFRSAVRRLAEERSRRDNESLIDQLEEQLGQAQTLAEQFGTGAPPPTVVDNQTLEDCD